MNKRELLMFPAIFYILGLMAASLSNAVKNLWLSSMIYLMGLLVYVLFLYWFSRELE